MSHKSHFEILESFLKNHAVYRSASSDDGILYVKHFRLDNPVLYDPKINKFLKYVEQIPSPPSDDKTFNNWKKQIQAVDINIQHFYNLKEQSDDAKNWDFILDYLNPKLFSKHILYAPFARTGNKMHVSYEAYLYPVFVDDEKECFYAPIVAVPDESAKKYKNIYGQNLGSIKQLENLREDTDYFLERIELHDTQDRAKYIEEIHGYLGFAEEDWLAGVQNRKGAERKVEDYLKFFKDRPNIDLTKLYIFNGATIINLAKANGIIPNKNYETTASLSKQSLMHHKFLLSPKHTRYMYNLQGTQKEIHAYVIHDKNEKIKGISMIMNQSAFNVFKYPHQKQNSFKNYDNPSDKWYTLVCEYERDANAQNGFDFDPKLYNKGIVQHDDILEKGGPVRDLLDSLHKRVAGVTLEAQNARKIFRFTSHPIVQHDMSQAIWLLCNEFKTKTQREHIICKRNGMNNLDVFCKNNDIIVLMLTSSFLIPGSFRPFGDVRVQTYHPTFQVVTKLPEFTTLEPWQIFQKENGRRYQNINKQQLKEVLELEEHHHKKDVLLIFSDKRILKYSDDMFLWEKRVLLEKYLDDV